MSTCKKLGGFFKQNRKRYLIGVSFLSVTAFLNIIPPKLLGLLADAVNHHAITWPTFLLVTLGVLISAVLLYLCRYFWRKEIWGGAVLLERDLRQKLYNHYLKMDHTFYQKYRIGDLMAHATNDINAVQQVAGEGVLTAIDAIFTGGITLIAMMYFVDWRLTLLCMFPMPLLAIGARMLGTRLHQAFGQSQAAFSKLNNKTQESISGIKVLKTFGQSKADTVSFDQMTFDTVKINKRVFRIDSMYDPMFSLIIGATYCLTIIFGGQMVMQRQISLGQLVAFVAYISRMDWPMFAIGVLFNILERGSASYDRITKIMGEQSSIIDSQSQPVALKGEIDYQIQTFQYPDDDHPTLKQIDFAVKPGQTLGIVGKVGAGKTTIIDLLMREYDHYDGQIKIDGQDIREIGLDSLLPQIAYVPQENFLFSESIKDNINFANPAVPMTVTTTAAKKAAVHHDVLDFDRAYQTLVGENGVALSGGQKQRMAIARALLKDSPILILDDALSAVDAKTEKAILANLKTERTEKTTIIATHRLSAVADADQIIVLTHGQIVERGTHAELLQAGRWYAQMWAKQELEEEVTNSDGK
ncbi:MAG: ATP-binding cassette domain-containing protein [Lactobacillus sp.]|nr:ATP-binding cassette domain-containing protein [Lactobacillus sp.]